MYAPLSHPETQAEIFPGYAPGSELKWAFNKLSLREPVRHLATVNKPGFDHPFDLIRDLELIERADSGQLSAGSTDLRVFFSRGGKLLMVHGWSDPQITPYQSIEYYGSVLHDLGDVRSSFRLFMVPGMEHSRGGEGVNDFDSLTVIEQWVEHGQAPERMNGRRLIDEKTVYTRPICPWPQVTKYDGSGDPNQPVHFICTGGSAPVSK
jgi:feruloyl esterase